VTKILYHWFLLLDQFRFCETHFTTYQQFVAITVRLVHSWAARCGDLKVSGPGRGHSDACAGQPFNPSWHCTIMVSLRLWCACATNFPPFLDGLLAVVTTIWRSEALLPGTVMGMGQWWASHLHTGSTDICRNQVPQCGACTSGWVTSHHAHTPEKRTSWRCPVPRGVSGLHPGTLATQQDN